MSRTAELLEAVRRDGYAVLPDALDPTAVDAVRAGLLPLLDGPAGRNDFEGRRTRRVYALAAKTRVVDPLVLHPDVLGLAEAMLGPSCLLSAALVAEIGPGEVAQPLHCDEGHYALPRPRAPLQLGTVWALSDFTPDNGATVVVPGSHLWAERVPEPARAVPVTMPAGSVLLFPGTLWHSGGANATERPRLGLTIQYTVGWCRPLETMLLAVPPDVVATMPERLRRLLGYDIHPPFMGHVDGVHPARLLPT